MEKSDANTWVIDSGSSDHITNDKTLFLKFNKNAKTEITVANGNKLKSYGSGDIKIQTDKNCEQITLKNALYIPKIKTNLLSISKATQNDCEVTFEKGKM